MGSLRGNSRKAKEAFGKYTVLENPVEIKIEELSDERLIVEKQLSEYREKLITLRRIDNEAVTFEDEDYIAARYKEFGEDFVPPKVQGLQGALTKEPLTYSIDWGKIKKLELTKSVEGQRLQMALEAIYGLQAKSEIAFEKEFGVAKADIEGFLGAMGKVEASASYDWNEVVLEAVADFFAGAKLTCNGELRVGSVDNHLKATLKGTAIAGIEAVGNAKIRLTPGQLSAALELSAFAGARAEAEGEFSATVFGRPLFTSKLKATASVGIGASLSAHLDVGVQNIGLGFGADLTVGVGAGAEVTTTLNVGNVVMSFWEAKDRLLEAPNYLQGYSNLGLQDREWRIKIDAVAGKYDALIKERTKELNSIDMQLKRLNK